MKRFLIIAVAALSILGVSAQTEVSEYRPGLTEDGITYFLPTTNVRIAFTVTRTHYEPGEFYMYADRFLRLKDVPQTTYDEWHIDKVDLYTYGIADKEKAYTIKLKPKTSAPLVGLAKDGRLLSVNTEAQPEAQLPNTCITDVRASEINGADYKTEEILAAGSKVKMAEFTANEIYDIRENRGLLTKGQADFMPKDGEQLRIMLANLDRQEEGLLQLFKGTRKIETHIIVMDFTPTTDVTKSILCRFSKYLGFVDKDDPAGAPVYISIKNLHSVPMAQETSKGKSKKETEDLRYVIPGRASIQLFTDDAELATQTLSLAQFGTVEHLGGDLFNKKYTTSVLLSPDTGGIAHITADKPE